MSILVSFITSTIYICSRFSEKHAGFFLRARIKMYFAKSYDGKVTYRVYTVTPKVRDEIHDTVNVLRDLFKEK